MSFLKADLQNTFPSRSGLEILLSPLNHFLNGLEEEIEVTITKRRAMNKALSTVHS